MLAGQTLAGRRRALDSNGASGDGKVLLNVNSADPYLTANGCLPYNLLEDVGPQHQHNLENRIVPILEKGLPTGNLWNLGLTKTKHIIPTKAECGALTTPVP